MSTLHQILEVGDLNQSLELLKTWGYQVKPYGDLILVKTTDRVVNHQYKEHNLKGLICTTDGTIVAPGCTVPLDENAESPSDILHYSKARDGVLFRFYHHNNTVKMSTSGRIVPNTSWGERGCKSFLELLSDVKEQWTSDLLHKDWCYYAILEHKDFTNIVKHPMSRLTLISIIDTKTLKPVDLDKSSAFVNKEVFFAEAPLLSEKSACPVSEDDVGYNIHYANCVRRVESPLYLSAQKIKPNLPDPRQHWVNLYKKDNDTTFTDDVSNIDTYLAIFPWQTEIFEEMHKRYCHMVDDIVSNYHNIVNHGWRRSNVFPRYVKYMNDLIQLNISNAGYKEIADHLISQEVPRIYYMLNPYDVAPYNGNLR